MKLIGRTSTTFKLGKRFIYMHLSFIYADISITKVFFFSLEVVPVEHWEGTSPGRPNSSVLQRAESLLQEPQSLRINGHRAGTCFQIGIDAPQQSKQSCP